MRARQGGFFANATWVSEMLGIALNPAVVALYANCTLTSHIFAVPCHFGALRARTTEEGKMRNRFCFIEYLGVGAGDGNRTHVRSLGSFYTAIVRRPLIPLVC